MKNAVILSLYNGSQFIIEQLKSLKEQTCKIDEVLIIDDCSSDDSYNICEEYINNNELNNWYIIKNDTNKGYAYNFLMNTDKINADIIFFCDQDDIWDLKKVELISQKFDSCKDALVICSDMETFFSGTNNKNFSKKYMNSMLDDDSFEKLKINSNNFKLNRSGCTMAIRKDFLNSISTYWVNSWPHDDMVWKFAIINNGLYLYHKKLINRRLHNNNTSIDANRTYNKRIKQIDVYYNSMSSLIKYCEDKSIKIYKAIEINKKCAINRKKFLNGHNIFRWIILYKNRKLYQTKKGVFLDLYLFIKRK